jgi:hypothetical protein
LEAEDTFVEGASLTGPVGWAAAIGIGYVEGASYTVPVGRAAAIGTRYVANCGCAWGAGDDAYSAKGRGRPCGAGAMAVNLVRGGADAGEGVGEFNVAFW